MQDKYIIELTAAELSTLRTGCLLGEREAVHGFRKAEYDRLWHKLNAAQKEQDAMPAMETIWDESGIAIGEARPLNEASDIDLAVGGTCCD